MYFFLLIFGLTTTLGLPADNPAKTHIKNAETLLKYNKYFEAYEEVDAAIQLDPKNKRFKEELSKIGQAASRQAETNAREKLSSSPKEAIAWLEKAVHYDPSNTSASLALKALQTSISEASKNAGLVREYLDSGELSVGKKLLDSIAAYGELVPSIDPLQKAVASETHMMQAETYWKTGESDSAAKELAEAESSPNAPLYVKTKSPQLRRELSKFYVSKVSNTSSKSLGEILIHAKTLNNAIGMDPENDEAIKQKDRLIDDLGRMLPSRATASRSSAHPLLAARVSLEEVAILEKEFKSDRNLLEQRTKLTSLAYPLVRVRFSIGEPSGCEPLFDAKTVEHIVTTAIGPAATIDAQNPDITLTVHDVQCSKTDIPRQSEQTLNSTYVAGKNQLENPEYVQLLVAVQQLQIEVARLQVDNQNNPNFGTALALGVAQGRLDRSRSQLSRTAPYIESNIYQQYQYRKFTAYRAFEIVSSISLSARGAKHIFGDDQVRVVVERRGDGASGVLPEDNTGAKNITPDIDPIERLASESKDQLVHEYFSKSRELLAKYFASNSKSAELDGTDKLGYLLYAADLSKGTALESEYAAVIPSFYSSLMAGPSHIESFSVPAGISTLREIESEDAATGENESALPSIESFIQGVVQIETDSAIGSGFFVNSGCQIITNYHVVEGADTIVVKTSSKKLLVGQLVEFDAGRDLALLRVGIRECHYLKLGPTEIDKVGEEVYAIGSPLGLSNSVTRGIVSARRTLRDGVRYLQVDATINHGNSGGPLLTRNGYVIGVNTFKVKGYEGLNFAIAASEIKQAFRKYIQ